MKQNLNILFASPEASPYAKTGGLADVLSALPRALAALDQKPSIIIPNYKTISKNHTRELILKAVPIPISDRSEEMNLYRTFLTPDIPVYLVDKPKYYSRDGLYSDPSGDYQDNAERFIFFCRAVATVIPLLPHPVDIVHTNDWQTALIPLYLKHLKTNENHFDKITSLFTIHNLAYQGLFWRFDMHLTGLPWDYFTSEGIEYYGDLNLLKAGIVYADAVNTVSKQYCDDITTAEYGCGLDGVLRLHRNKLHGIQNGIDMDTWNPETDPYLPKNFSRESLDGKAACKTELLARINLQKNPDEPLIGMVTRLSSQKGLNILSQGFDTLMQKPLKLVLLGAGDQHFNEEFSDLRSRYPEKFAFINMFDEQLAHLIEAGSDIYLMPSRYEPSGLNQLYSMRYGTVPVVRATGGLKDTVIDYDPIQKSGTGFVFNDYTSSALIEAVSRALQVFSIKTDWHGLQMAGMKQDFSWDRAAGEYLTLYQNTRKLKQHE